MLNVFQVERGDDGILQQAHDLSPTNEERRNSVRSSSSTNAAFGFNAFFDFVCLTTP